MRRLFFLKVVIFNTAIIVFVSLILILSIRGLPGNPNTEQMNTKSWTTFGPFELSPERGRFALTYSYLEDKSFSFSLPIAKFATPDLGYINNKYVSLFAPGVSFLIIPGYILGKFVGLSQVGSYAVITLFALLNVILIKVISNRLGANTITGWIGALVFIFASPAFAYAVNLYQHHISVFLMLLAIYILIRWNSLLSLAAIWFLIAVAIVIDYPNLVLMSPIALFALDNLIKYYRESKKLTVSFNLKGILTIITVALPLLFFFWFNAKSYGNPWQLSGTVTQVFGIDRFGNPIVGQTVVAEDLQKVPNQTPQRNYATSFFQTRNILNGFYIHFISPDRGVLYFTPVVLFGILGAILAYKRKIKLTQVMVAIVGANILLYSMWGDPWGGWAFGSRYLIPTYAILSIFIAFLLTFKKESLIFWILFLIVFSYSVSVNTIGAITSSSLPPKIEVLELEKNTKREQKYTYQRNFDYLQTYGSKSFLFQFVVFKYLTAMQYYLIINSLIILTVTLLIVVYRPKKTETENV